MDPIVVFITCANNKEAKLISRKLVENRLAACVNIVDKIESIFRWQGKIDQAKEALLIIKSGKAKLRAIIKLVRAMHSYQVPEIIAIAIAGGYKPYLRWIDDSIRQPR